jgi:hypothetical protein
MQTLLPLAPATASIRSTGLPFFFFFFFFSFFYFSLLLFPFSFFFLFFYFFIPSPSFPHLIFLVALLEGAREGIINNYHHFIDNYRNNFVNFQKFLTIDC